jgi:hypothetical protein
MANPSFKPSNFSAASLPRGLADDAIHPLRGSLAWTD